MTVFHWLHYGSFPLAALWQSPIGCVMAVSHWLHYGSVPLAELLLGKEESFLPPAKVVRYNSITSHQKCEVCLPVVVSSVCLVTWV